MEKEMQAQAPDAPTKSDRSLNITCTPTLVWTSSTPPYNIGATMVYTETSSNPPMPNVVNHATGDINLRNMPTNANFTDNIDIFLTLDTSALVDPNGNSVAGRWAQAGEGSDPGMGAAWFISVPPPVNYTPITVPTGMVIDRRSDTLVVIDDNTPDGSPTYAFCTAIVLPGYGNYFISFEPLISTKGKGDPPMMLKK